MAEAAGDENLFLFGVSAEQVAETRGWYSPQWRYDNEPETRAAVDLVFSGHFSHFEPGIFDPIRDMLLPGGDHYMHLADLQSYLEADGRVVELYRRPNRWAHTAILNVVASGCFSSDRTIAEYILTDCHNYGLSILHSSDTLPLEPCQFARSYMRNCG